jgi:hypothetical protein
MLVAALVAAGGFALFPVPASADRPAVTPDQVLSAGPIRLQDGEKILIGMLLPAVQRARLDAQFLLTDGQGKTLYSSAAASGKATYFNVTFHAKPVGTQNGPSLEISNGAVIPDFVSVDPAGILIGMLLPAVNRSGQSVSPMAASMQAFNANGATMAYAPLGSHGKPD